MSSRTIQHPGIEINEIDRSQYGKVDYSLPNAPTSLHVGFTDRGEDCALTWINSKATLDSTYGIPQNEYEKYFYNAATEILNRGGTCIAAKLPYDNAAYQKYNYVQLSVSGIQLSNDVEIDQTYNTIRNCCETLKRYLARKNIHEEIPTVRRMFEILRANYIEDMGDDEIEPYMTLRDFIERLKTLIANVPAKYFALFFADTDLTSYLEISNSELTAYQPKSPKSSIEDLDDLLTGSKKVIPNTIRIYDMTRQRYASLDRYNGCVKTGGVSTNDCLGIVPIVTTATNALFFQKAYDFIPTSAVDKYKVFNQISGFTTVFPGPVERNEQGQIVERLGPIIEGKQIETDFSQISAHVSLPLASLPDPHSMANGSDYDSLSHRAADMFPTISYKSPDHFDPEHLKDIGVCVFKAYVDYDNNKTVNFQLLESFVGSLDKNARDPLTHASKFIDNVVNEKSQYIKLFSNVNADNYQKATVLATSLQQAVSLGFYGIECYKRINYKKSIVQPLTQILDIASNRYNFPIDIVIDAGMSNISQIAVNQSGSIDAEVFPMVSDVDWTFSADSSGISGWKMALSKFDNFCKYQRKDCMFLADGLRVACLDGNLKYVRKTSPSNTVTNMVMPKFRYMVGALNSSYSAGYCNWFYQQDYGTGDYFWIPPSIKAAGVYVYCDTYFHPWSAPAGLVRGVLNDVVDVAFIPQEEDADKIYSNQWNYAMSYPIEGIVIEGHKTFQLDKTALDRVNVRRLLLSIEKKITRVARAFVYENNTPYLRQRFVEMCRPIIEDAVTGDGISEYAIKCDDELNTPQVIENNELRCRIAIKPIKTVDFIVIDIISTKQSASVSEEVLR